MNNMLMVPVAVLVFTGLALQLNDIAERTSMKTIIFASDAYEAIDCAVEGIEIGECSPNLAAQADDFVGELEAFHELTEEIVRNISNETQVLHLIFSIDDSFRLEYNGHYDDIVLQEVYPEGGVRIGVQQDDLPTVEEVIFYTTSDVKIDIDKDGNYDAVLLLNDVWDESAELEIGMVRGQVTPLEVSFVFVFIFFALAIYLWCVEK